MKLFRTVLFAALVLTGGSVASSQVTVVTEASSTWRDFPGQTSGNPSGQQTTPPSSSRGLFRMEVPKSVVFGERFNVQVTLPPPRPGEETWGYFIWGQRVELPWEEKEKDSSPDLPIPTPVQLTEGTHTVQVYAPHARPGRFELRLFRTSSKLIDLLEVSVTKGEVPDALQLRKTTFKPDEPIEFIVRLPENRFYSGHNSGPSVLLYPIEIGGKRLSNDDAVESLKLCAGLPEPCGMGLLPFVRGAPYSNPHDGGYEIKPGTYPITRDLATAKGFGPLLAPKKAGRYELRLYHREPPLKEKLREYVDLYLASREITVVESTVSAEPTLRFMRQSAGKFEEIKDKAILYPAEVYLEAEYVTAQPDKQPVAKVTWLGGPDDQPPNTKAKYDTKTGIWTLEVPLSRVPPSDKLFRSKPILVAPPQRIRDSHITT